MLLSIVGAIGAILLVIVIHEAGHFMVARAVGIHVERFSIGFGRPLCKWYGKTGTEYVIAMLPFGGYVKMLGDENDGSDKTRISDQRAYINKSVWQRMAVVLAGPMANFVLALLIYMAIYTVGVHHLQPVIGKVRSGSVAAKAGFERGQKLVSVDGYKASSWQRVLMAMILRYGDAGKMQVVVRGADDKLQTMHVPLADWRFDMLNPAPFLSMGFTPFAPLIPAVIAKIIPGSAAQKYGLKVGDRIMRINSKPIKDWRGMSKVINKSPNQTVHLELLRAGKKLNLTVILGSEHSSGRRIGLLGAMANIPPLPAGMISTTKQPLWLAWRPAFKECVLLLHFNVLSIWKMLNGDISVKALGGPITIFRSAGTAAASGIMVYASFIAFISLMIGFINILPIPALDGGHFFFQVIEVIFGKPVPILLQRYAIFGGIAALLLLMIQATVNDVLRLF